MRRILTFTVFAVLLAACGPEAVTPAPQPTSTDSAQPTEAVAAAPSETEMPTAALPTDAPTEPPAATEAPTDELGPATEASRPTETSAPTETPGPTLDGIPVALSDDGLFYLGQMDAPVTVKDYGDFL
jgi:chitinase